MNKLTFKEWSILADLETITLLKEDYEFSMARGELKTAQSAITRLMVNSKVRVIWKRGCNPKLPRLQIIWIQ
jgi:hypothetical protein